MDPVRFALVGCGRIAKKHAEALAKTLPDARLTAVCDVRKDRAEQYGKAYGVPFFTDYNAMMGAAISNIDVVNILTPSGMHAAHAIELAKYGKHIVVEKPMALTLDDADAMIQACDQGGVKLFVVKQNRYNHAVQKVRGAVEQGRFGKFVMGTVRVRWCREQKYYDQDSWRGTWKLDGGVFSNQASHHIDLLEWMLGDVETVFAKSSTRLVKIETEDTGIALLKFKNGALGIVEATTATRPKDLEGSLSILGEFGTAEVGGFAVNAMKVWNFVDEQPGDEEILRTVQNPSDVYGFGHVAYFRNVIDCVRLNKKALVDGLEGRRSLELITAMYESIEAGREVALRFAPRMCRLGH